MGSGQMHAGSSQGKSVSGFRGRETLASIYQEALTATARLRANRQLTNDAEAFRAQLRVVLQASENEAALHGYNAEDVRLATFAVVAFLDESVLNSANPVFANWPRMPLQEEMFGGHIAGEMFFQCIDRLLARDDSRDVADVLEIYALCLMLGYRGRYSLHGGEGLRAIVDSVMQKVWRIRGGPSALSPEWAPPAEAPRPKASDPWVRRLGIGAAACLFLAVLLLVGFKISLSSGASGLRSVASLVSQ